MDNVNKLLYHVLSVALFGFAIFFLTYIATSYNKVIKSSKEALSDNNIYQQVIPDKDIVSYGELIASLCVNLEYNVRIDEILIFKNTHNPGKIIGYDITETNYLRSYTYNDNGEILCVIYTSIS